MLTMIRERRPDPAAPSCKPPQRGESHEHNRPEVSLSELMLTAIIAQNQYSRAAQSYQESNQAWKSLIDQIIDRTPEAKKALEKCRKIKEKIGDLRDSGVDEGDKQIAELYAKYETTGLPYSRAYKRASNNPGVVEAAITRERHLLAMNQTEARLESIRTRALAAINSDLKADLTWKEADSIFGTRLKQELEVAESRVLSATADRQRTLDTIDQIIESRLNRLRSGQAAAIRIVSLSDD